MEEDVQDLGLVKRNISRSDPFIEDFLCSVCLQLVIQPTTLTCGHTSCRVCLAKWYQTCKKKTCPLCKQLYYGHPKINTQMRNMIKRIVPDLLDEREHELNQDTSNEKVVKTFDKNLSGAEKSGPGGKDDGVVSFFLGVLIALCFCVVCYLAWYWQTADTNLLVNKPVEKWKPKDVVAWLSEMKWATQYEAAVEDSSVDGTLLLSLDEDSVKERLNVTDPSHSRALVLAINMLRQSGMKQPNTLWEYKALYPGRCLFLVFALQGYPRATFLYLSMYFNEDMFLPFLVATTMDDSISDVDLNITTLSPSLRQWTTFICYWVMLPAWPICVFAYQMFEHHFYTPCFVILMMIEHTIFEITTMRTMFLMKDWRSLVGLLKEFLKKAITAFGFMIIWPLVPSLICDICFYAALYISPFLAARRLYVLFTENR